MQRHFRHHLAGMESEILRDSTAYFGIGVVRGECWQRDTEQQGGKQRGKTMH